MKATRNVKKNEDWLIARVQLLRSSSSLSGPPYDRTLLYVHGGGWVASNSEVTLHWLTPLVRQGIEKVVAP